MCRYNAPPNATSLRAANQSRESPWAVRSFSSLSALQAQVATGCKKETSSQAVPVVPDNSTYAPPGANVPSPAVSGPDEAINLSPYMIRGELSAPKGVHVRRRLGAGSCFIDGGSGFAIEIEPASIPLAATKEQWSSLNPHWIKDEPNVLLAELRGIAPGMYAFEARSSIGRSNLSAAKSDCDPDCQGTGGAHAAPRRSVYIKQRQFRPP